jgi:hypothetical protein
MSSSISHAQTCGADGGLFQWTSRPFSCRGCNSHLQSHSTSSSRLSRSVWRRGSRCSKLCTCGPGVRPTVKSSSSGSRFSGLHSGSVSSPGLSWHSSSARTGACWHECRDLFRGRSLLRDLHRLFSRSELFRDPSVWSLARPTVVLSVLDGDGGAWNHPLGVLDYGQ